MIAHRVGQQLGNYRLLRLLGRGGFAEVYLAQHVYLQRRVALKVLHTSLSDEDVEPFLAEAQTLARLAHPNIVSVFDFAVEEATPFLVMDYAPRGTLRQMHPRGSCLSLATTAAYVKQVAADLQYAHNHKVIHRDVKPENMLLGSQQEILLSDFGLALFAPSPEQVSTQEMAGTLPYMAPEQIRGKPEFASDQYSLGIVVYEWLTGVRPFEGTSWQVAYQHISVEPPPLREKDPSLPEALEAVVHRVLAKNPRDRYVSMQLFAQVLERACGRSLSDYNGAAITEGTAPLVARSPEAPPTSKQIFLAAAPADATLTDRLRTDVQQQGVAVWNEEPLDTQESRDQQDRAHQAIRAVDLVVLIVSSQTRASRLVKEYLRIVGLYQRRLVLVWMEGEDIAPLLLDAGGRPERIEVIDAREGRYPLAIDELVAYLREDTAVGESVVADLPFEPRNPYKGLRAFTQADAADFFGRDALIEDLVDRLKDLLASERSAAPRPRLLPVLGASGSGKSSLVMAGLLPHLQQGVLPDSEHWVYLEPIVPGPHPLETLALKLAACFPERSVKSIREDLEDESARGLHLLACRLVKSPAQKVVLLVDQFEEVLTLTTDEQERVHFLTLLLTAMTEPGGPVIVLLTLRADFYDRLGTYPLFGRLIVEQQVVVWPMELEDLRAVIKRPAALPDVQLSFEGNLVGDLLFDVQGQVGALPLLAFTLEQLFERRREHRLTLSAYREIGGVKGALSQHAEQTYTALPSEQHRHLARVLFLRLIDPGASEQDTTRRRAALSEFSLADATSTRLLRETADAFIEARLLTTNEVAGTTTMEVSHEAVIREWKRLKEWIHEAREDLHLLQVIREDANEWKRHGRSVDRLYRGTQLAEALTWRERSLPSLDEQAFLQASIDEQARQEALLAERQRQEAWQQQRSSRRTILVGLVGLGLTGSALAVGRWYFQRNTPLPPLPLPYIYRGHTSSVISVAWSPDGQRLASASEDRTVRIWDTNSGQTLLIYTGHINNVRSVAWSPDGQRIASASNDDTVHVWDANSGQTRLVYRSHTDPVSSVAWSPDGKHLASSSHDGTVHVWDASSGQTRFVLGGGMESVAWSPDGQYLASTGATGDGVRIWDAGSGQTRLTYKGHTDFVNDVAWSPNGQHLASASADRTVHVWDARSGQTRLTYKGHTDAVESVAWSPNGKYLASASADSTVRLWDASNGHSLRTYTGHTNLVRSVTWSPNGKYLASASYDHTVQEWNVGINSGNTILTCTGHTDIVSSVAWSPDGQRLASASYDHTVRLWDANSGQGLLTYRGHTGAAQSVAWSPDGQRLASADYDHTVYVWDASSGQTRLIYRGHTDIVQSVAWSPDGQRLASASNDGTVHVWDANSGQTRLTCKGAYSVAWSPDGQRLASSGGDSTVRLWDANSGQSLLTYRGHSHTDIVWSVAWSPDGQRIASASTDVRIWDASSGQSLLTYKGRTDAVQSVAWSPNGKYLASASTDNTIHVWDASSGQTRLIYRGHTNYVNSVAWSPDGQHLASASHDRTVQVWLWLG